MPKTARRLDMDDTQKALMQMVLDRVNEVNKHRIDMDSLLGQVENLITGIGGIEELAMEVENGEFELEPQERDI